MFQLIETKTVPTVCFTKNGRNIYFHSKYDPIKEVSIWVKTTLEEIYEEGNIIIIGLAAGYHIQALAEKIPNRQIEVIEFNHHYAKWFQSTPLASPFNKIKNVTLYTPKNLNEVQHIFRTHSSNVRIHRNGMDLLPKGYKDLKEALKDLEMGQFSFRHQKENVFHNFELNEQFKDEGIRHLKNQYEGKKAILIAAGPSLDKQLSLLNEIEKRDQFVIGAVGTAMKPLEKAGVEPDFFTIIDPNEGTYPQLTNVSFPSIPLYYMSTAYHETIKLHTGPRYIYYQQGLDIAEQRAKERGEPLIQTGGSVATALLDLFVYFGCTTIALVGQDLAYTQNKSHAQNANSMKAKTGSMTILGWDGKSTVTTNRNLNSYRKWFESYAKKNPHLQLYNCTEGGAYINNFKNISFKNFIDR